MSNHSVSSGRGRVFCSLGIVGAIVVSLFSSPAALADIKQECSDAYDKTQDLRDADKLEEALKEAQICSREACAKFIRDDCAKWKADIEAREASIILEIADASGAPVTDGSVSLDGAPWLDHVDGSAHVVSKGAHTLEITAKGAAPHKESVTIQEGEKNRKVTITIAAKPLGSDEAPPGGVHRIGPWIVGGVGVAALIGGAVTGGLVVQAHGVMKAQCSDTTKTCTPDGRDAETRGQELGPATTGLLVGGGALVAAGIIWLVAAPREAKHPANSLFVAPVVWSDRKGVVFGGGF